jgi:hypothetical protein
MDERSIKPELRETPALSGSDIVISDGITYSVNKLIEIAKSHEPKEISISELQKALEVGCWSDSNGKKITPKEVIEAMRAGGDERPELREHIERIKNSNLKHPILAVNIDNKLVVLDGMHRLVRSVLDQNASALIIKFESLPRGAQV